MEKNPLQNNDAHAWVKVLCTECQKVFDIDLFFNSSVISSVRNTFCPYCLKIFCYEENYSDEYGYSVTLKSFETLSEQYKNNKK